jgi:hypothetical protein
MLHDGSEPDVDFPLIVFGVDEERRPGFGIVPSQSRPSTCAVSRLQLDDAFAACALAEGHDLFRTGLFVRLPILAARAGGAASSGTANKSFEDA